MESLLFRTGSGSIPVQAPLLPASPRHSVSFSVQGSIAGEWSGVSSSRNSLHMEVSRRNIRRSYSESDVTLSEVRTLSKLGSRSFTAPRIAEVECDECIEERTEGGISWEELGFPGGGMNNNRNSGGGGSGGSGSDADRQKMGAYYQKMLKSDPTNSLLLRNYGKYLHEVERDVVKAEEYYGRAILSSPGDGEVLSLYGKLIWETQRDENRAKSYFTQALQASPHDSVVLGSYAHFLWEAEEEENEEMEKPSKDAVFGSICALKADLRARVVLGRGELDWLAVIVETAIHKLTHGTHPLLGNREGKHSMSQERGEVWNPTAERPLDLLTAAQE
ncbi:hypothetical protein DH2020_020317 [Rehmannia glutinosa]|uniref:Uncharacterized protein n=1 Tax=Rehmannia glutinosa TaxID=99300 RepID=A0ABR0WHY0_REHGL